MNNPILRTQYGSKVKFLGFSPIKDMFLAECFGYQRMHLLVDDLAEESKEILKNLRDSEDLQEKVDVSPEIK